ncbi:transmembrane protein [Ceratobasidium sp. AG-Ba]|nr:transmembrane protein [Ceratobasidium sp. AG-Ba]
MSGTASTLVELLGYEEGALDPAPVLDAQARQLRRALTPQILWGRINWGHLSSIMALHCLNFLVRNCTTISNVSEYVTSQLRQAFAIHRMPDGHQTKAHPLSSSNINENSAAGCRDALEDILIRQLGLSREAVAAAMLIIGGDLGSIEKVRALIALSSSCPHGYSDFRWIIPLVQLWHMGWADF